MKENSSNKLTQGMSDMPSRPSSSNKLTKGMSDMPSRPSLCLIWLNGPFIDIPKQLPVVIYFIGVTTYNLSNEILTASFLLGEKLSKTGPK